MTVKELIKILKDYPSNTRILVNYENEINRISLNYSVEEKCIILNLITDTKT